MQIQHTAFIANTHSCQVGWKYLAVGKGSGMLSAGGSYVSYVSTDNQHFTLVVEKLEGRCLRCRGQVRRGGGDGGGGAGG